MHVTKPTSPSMASVPVCVWPAAAELGEGAHWSRTERALYWVDILGQQLHRWSPHDRQATTWSFQENISAVVEQAHSPGLMLAMRHSLATWNPHQAHIAPKVFADLESHCPTNRCNDGKCDALGRFWIGTMDFAAQQPTGALYRVDPDGAVRQLESGFAVFNGPTWTIDQRTMLLNDTVGGRVWAYDFDLASGELHNRRLWLQFNDADGKPDGMTTDAMGRIWICHWGGACVTCHDPRHANELMRIHLPVRLVTSCAFGGDDRRSLFITTAREGLSASSLAQQPLAGGLFEVRLESPGCDAFHFER